MSSEALPKDPKLKHSNALYSERLIYGVPTKTFFAATAFVLVFFITAGWLAAIVVFFITIPPLVVVHKDDIKALPILFDKLRRPDRYVAGGVIYKPFKTIKLTGKIITIKNLKDIQG